MVFLYWLKGPGNLNSSMKDSREWLGRSASQIDALACIQVTLVKRRSEAIDLQDEPLLIINL